MGKVVRTETTVKEIDDTGAVVRETTTIVEIQQPAPVDAPQTGLYL